jgi:hypothetical protein
MRGHSYTECGSTCIMFLPKAVVLHVSHNLCNIREVNTQGFGATDLPCRRSILQHRRHCRLAQAIRKLEAPFVFSFRGITLHRTSPYDHSQAFNHFGRVDPSLQPSELYALYVLTSSYWTHTKYRDFDHNSINLPSYWPRELHISAWDRCLISGLVEIAVEEAFASAPVAA